MFLRGLLVAASGFLFIFSPGLPMRLLTRHSPLFHRDMVYWGIGVWLIALLPSLFLQSLLRQILQKGALSGPPSGYALTAIGALLTALFVAGAMYLVLRFKGRDDSPGHLPGNGMALGFGVGLIAQVFTGLSLAGAGFRLMFGDTSTETLVGLTQIGFVELILALLSLILFRPALLAVSAVRGVLVARSFKERPAFFGLAVVVDAAFVWSIVAFQIAFGDETAGQVLAGNANTVTSTVTVVYYILAFALAYRWLMAQIAGWESARTRGKGNRDAGT